MSIIKVRKYRSGNDYGDHTARKVWFLFGFLPIWRERAPLSVSGRE